VRRRYILSAAVGANGIRTKLIDHHEYDIGFTRSTRSQRKDRPEQEDPQEKRRERDSHGSSLLPPLAALKGVFTNPPYGWCGHHLDPGHLISAARKRCGRETRPLRQSVSRYSVPPQFQTLRKRDVTHRVIQWSTGNVGKAALRQIIHHPDLELVGCLVHNDEKAGRDVGDLCKESATGVIATKDLDAILALDADCVSHMPLPSAQYGDDPGADLDNICRVLESGKNVVTTVGYVYPKAYGPEVEERLQRACQAGGTSLHGTGANPGWMSDVLPLTMSALSSRIDRIFVRESTNFSWYPSPEVIFGLMGMGCSEREFEAHSKRYTAWLSGLFRESILLLADGLEVELDDVRFRSEWRVGKQDFDIAAGRVPAGTVAAQRLLWSAIVAGEPVIELEAIYKVHADAATDWPEAGFTCLIEGRPRMSFELEESWINNGLVATAVHAVHAIPVVCDAAPGIRTFLDLPLIRGRHTLRRA
jgi:hypothetical protein